MIEANAQLDGSWVAVHVKSNHERAVEMQLAMRDYETFLPLEAAAKPLHAAGSSRVRRTERPKAPLFPGYVFCRFKSSARFRILDASGVIRILGRAKAPEPVPESELEPVRRLSESGCYTAQWRFMQTGDRARLIAGPLAGLEGFLVAVKDSCRMVLSVMLLQRSVAVEVSPDQVEPVEKARVSALAYAAACGQSMVTCAEPHTMLGGQVLSSSVSTLPNAFRDLHIRK